MPNFTGTWRYSPARSVLQIEPPEATELVMEHNGPVLRLTRTHLVSGRRDTFTVDLAVGGAETTLQRRGMELRCRAWCDGDALTFDTVLWREGSRVGTNAVRYTLLDEGATLRAEERFRSEAMNYDNVWMLDRVEG